jgi:alpha,alpha-trehalase
MTATETLATRPERVLDFSRLHEFHLAMHARGGRLFGDCKIVTDMYDPAVPTDSSLLLLEAQEHSAVGYEAVTDDLPSLDAYISDLWDVLRRPGNVDGRGMIQVPHDIFVPGERYIENYYWDALEIMRGLAIEGRWQDVRGIVGNGAHLIGVYGYIPNGTRDYFVGSEKGNGRSQSPVFAEMVELLAEHEGPEAIVEFLPAMQAELAFWMDGADRVASPDSRQDYRRVVRVPDGQGGTIVLNRYYDDTPGPRPEGLCRDLETARLAVEHLGADAEQVFLDLRAACESGWDFSSRWLADGRNLYTICTTSILPIDLQCNILKLQQMIAQGLELRATRTSGAQSYQDMYEAVLLRQQIEHRAQAIRNIFWDPKQRFFFDYNFRQEQLMPAWSLAAVNPLDIGVATAEQAASVLDHIGNETTFMQPGGLMASLHDTDEQWDGRNGWGPLHFRAARAAWRNNRPDLALTIRDRFMKSCEKTYQRLRLMVEKVDVRRPGYAGNEGEYPCQRGFGWTNGDYKALKYFMFVWGARIAKVVEQFGQKPETVERIARSVGSLVARRSLVTANGAAGS